MSSQAAWDFANRYSANCLLIGGIGTVLAQVVLLFLLSPESSLRVAAVLVVIVPLAIIAIVENKLKHRPTGTGNSEENASIYPAKVDFWVWLVLIGASLGLIAWGGWTWPANRGEAIVLIGAGVFGTILIALLFPCHYTIEKSEVLIRSGILRYRVPIDQVRSVNLSSNPLSAPAPSLKRVEILLENGKSYLISPLDREGFIRELRDRVAKC
jgi:membrane protein YdbS with pleckstrin-like domain